jgi:hypothetical protein
VVPVGQVSDRVDDTMALRASAGWVGDPPGRRCWTNRKREFTNRPHPSPHRYLTSATETPENPGKPGICRKVFA